MSKLSIPIHDKHIVMPCLFHSQIGAGVLQFFGKWNGTLASDGIEIPAQIVGKIHRDLPCFQGIELAKAVDAHQGIIDEMRPHLQHHDIGALISDFPLLQGNFFLLFGNFPFLQECARRRTVPAKLNSRTAITGI